MARKISEVFVEVRADLSKLRKGMKSAMGVASGGASVIGRVLGGVASVIKGALTAAFNVVATVIKTVYNVIVSLFSAMIKWAKRGVLALSAFVAVSVVVGSKFGQSMARVKALTGASTKEFKALRAEARRLGRATEYSANQAADAMSIFAMAGFNTKDVITSMTPTLDFAAASGLDLASAADIAARVMGGMQLEAKDLANTMDILTAAYTSANMDASDLGEAMKFVGAVGKTVGKDTAELVGSLVALAKAGNRGSMAGTGLRKVLMGLATSKIQKRLAKMGVSITDTTGAMKPISKIIGDIGRATAKLSDMEIADLGVAMFGARGGVAFLQLVGQGEAAIKQYTDSLQNVGGTTKKIAAIQRDTLATSFKIVQSAIADVMITVTDIMEPTLRGAADSQVKMWNKIGEVLGVHQTVIQGFIKGTVDWLKSKLPAAINISVGAVITLFDKVRDNFGSLMKVGKAASGLFSNFFEVKSLKGTVFDKVIQAAGIAFIKIKNMILHAFNVILAQVKLVLEKINTTMNEQRWSNKFKKMWGGAKKVARTVGTAFTLGHSASWGGGKKIGDIWDEGSEESADVVAGRARENTLENQLKRAMLGKTQGQEDKEIARFIEGIIGSNAKEGITPKTFSKEQIAKMTKDEVKLALTNVASQYKPAMDKGKEKELDLMISRLRSQFKNPQIERDAKAAVRKERDAARIKEHGLSPLDVFEDGEQEIFRDPAASLRPMSAEKKIGDIDFMDEQETFRDPTASLRPMSVEKKIGDIDFMDQEIDWDNLAPTPRRVIETDVNEGGKTLVEGFEKAGETFLNGLKTVLLPKKKPQMSIVGKNFFQGKLDLFGFKKMGHDASVAAEKEEKRKNAKLDKGRSITLPEEIAGFTATIQTVIGSASVGVNERLAWAMDTARSNNRIAAATEATQASSDRAVSLQKQVVAGVNKTAKNTEDALK